MIKQQIQFTKNKQLTSKIEFVNLRRRDLSYLECLSFMVTNKTDFEEFKEKYNSEDFKGAFLRFTTEKLKKPVKDKEFKKYTKSLRELNVLVTTFIVIKELTFTNFLDKFFLNFSDLKNETLEKYMKEYDNL